MKMHGKTHFYCFYMFFVVFGCSGITGIANPCTPVRIRTAPPTKTLDHVEGFSFREIS